MKKNFIKIGNFIINEQPFETGSYGRVHPCKDENDNIYVAKIIEMSTYHEDKNIILNELNAYYRLNNDHIIKLHSVKRSKRFIYLILEYCDGKNLQQILQYCLNTFNRCFPLEVIQFIANGIKEGMIYFCIHNYAHRDLKLENIMLKRILKTTVENNNNDLKEPVQKDTISAVSLSESNKVKDIYCLKEEKPSYMADTFETFVSEIKKYFVKIIDLGFVKRSQNNMFSTILGTENYIAPEIYEIKNNSLYYSNKVDLWSFGCILYQLAFGISPFFRNNLINNDISKYFIPKPIKNIITFEFVDLINGLLRKDHTKRYDWDIVMNHPFLNEDISKQKPIKEEIQLDCNNSFNYFVKNIPLKKKMIDIQGNEIDKGGKIIDKCFYRFDSGGIHHEGILIEEKCNDEWVLVTDNGGTGSINTYVDQNEKCSLF